MYFLVKAFTVYVSSKNHSIFSKINRIIEVIKMQY